MLNKNELIAIGSVSLTLAIIISLLETWTIFFTVLGVVILVFLINIIAKKIVSFYLDSELEIKQWEFSRWGLKKHQHMKRPIPAGIFIPIIIKFVSVGILNWMACLTFEVKGKIYRAAKRQGVYSFSRITEREMGLIAGLAIIINLLFALLGYLIDYNLFARMNLAFAFYNLLPISNLDGSKIFFGSKIFWTVLMTITTLAVAGVILTI
jgi:Zn-dependent protease